MTETRIRVKTTLGVTDHNLLDNRFIDNQHTMNAISGLEEALESKQNVLTAGENIEISEEGVISAVDTTYTAGDNVEISEEGVISANVPEYTAGENVEISEEGVISATDTTYTAGDNVSIENGVISAVDTTYTAGENVSIENGVISAVDTTYTAGTGIDITNGVISNTQTSAEWGNIEGNINSQTDLKNALDAKANSADLAAVATSGSYTDLSGTPTLATVATSGLYSDLSETPTLANVATSGDYDDLSNKPTIPTITDTYSRVSHDGISGIAVASAISSAIASVYKPAGSSTFAELPPLAAGIEGYVFNMTDDFTTTSDFVDGAGKDYPAGTNIVCILTRDGYKWDVLAGIVDLSGYQTLIDSSHKLNSDLVDDTNATNKFVTASDKTTWNAKQDAISDLATIRAGASAGATAVQSSDLATVATSGLYSDLSETPTIPTVNDATITITQGGVAKGSFTLNQASSDTIALEAGGSVSFDGSTINENASNELQAIGVIDKNSGSALGFWHGTQAQYNNGGTVKDTYYDWETFPHNTSTLTADQRWISVAFGDNKFVTASNTDKANYSSDGQTWTASTLPASNTWSVGYGNGRFVALSGYITAYSDDGGETWTQGPNLPQDAWVAGWHIIYADNKFVAVTVNDANVSVYSTDGINWYSSTFTNQAQRYSIAYGNGKFITICNGTNILNVSTDGQTWNTVTLPKSKQWRGIAYGNNTFVILADSDCTTYYSTDGVNWVEGDQGNNVVTQVTFANNKFVALSNYGSYIKYSKDGITWSNAVNILNTGYHSIPAYNNGLFVTVNEYSNVSESFSIDSVYTLDENPTTASAVYSAPEVASALTITAVGTGTITLSDTNTYTYNAGGNTYSYYTVGESYPNYVCNIDGVGLKIGDNDVANLASYSAFGGATGSVAGSAGLVPAPAATDNDKYLKGDGTWAAVSGGSLPSQTGNSGKFLTTDGTDASWVTVDSLPSQTGNSGKYLTTNGTTASWATVSGGGLENTATGTDSLTILGTAATGSSSCNIGKSSTTSTHNYCAAFGNYAFCSNDWGVAIGTMATAGGTSSIAIGSYASATGQHSIQIGEGTNTTDNTLSIGFNPVRGKVYTLLNGDTGKIPNARINGVSGSFTSQDGKTITVTNGVITSIV